MPENFGIFFPDPATGGRMPDISWVFSISRATLDHAVASADLAAAIAVGSRRGAPVVFAVDAQRLH